MTSPSPFHLSVPVTDLKKARAFYSGILGCSEGRSADMRIDFNFFGHHLVTHVEPLEAAHPPCTIVSSGVPTPVRHFGVIVPEEQWKGLAARLQAAKADFFTEPQTVFPGEVREQFIMLVNDGCGNIVEFKSQPADRVFAREARKH